jgi:hypothetical protein
MLRAKSPFRHLANGEMKNKVDYLKAKQRITALFLPGSDPVAATATIGDDEMEALLDAIVPSLPLRRPSQMAAISMFLFEGCRRFDRWFAPSPYVVPTRHSERFCKFVNAFRRAERGDPTNCAVFRIHQIRDLVYKHFDGVPLVTIAASKVARYMEQISQISAPSHPVKKAEFEQQKTELTAILGGLGDRSLRTFFQFRIPYVLHKQILEVNFIWGSIAMRARIVPSFHHSEESIVKTGQAAALSIGASRWQTGTSSITIEQEALVDGSAYTDRLQTLPGRDLPVDGWPKSFTWAFSIFHDLVWRLRNEYGGHQDWIPAPRDLSDLELWLRTGSISSLSYIRKGSPATLLEVFVPNKELVSVNLGELGRLPWSTECRVRADMYLELGDTNEALFWLNVAVESLIAKRFSEIEAMIDRPGLVDELGSPREFWSQAEAIVAKQFPEIASKIKWPSAPIHISIYGKLKALYRLVPMRTSVKEVEYYYREISGERNDLFHGNRSTRTTVATVEVASTALAWIDANMWPLITH